MPAQQELCGVMLARDGREQSYVHHQISLYGAQGLGDRELVGVLLSGDSERRGVLAKQLFCGRTSVRELARASLATLRACGLGQAEAVRLRAAFELGRRSVAEPPPGHAVHSPQHAFRCVARCFVNDERERFVVAVLDIKNRPRHVSTVAVGAVDLCPVDPREVFGTAVRERGSAVIVAHNHPSGDPNPSREDLALTDRLVGAGAVLGVPVLDHIIVGNAAGCFVSLAERGLMPSGRQAA